jgi:hypothetical protein
MRFATRTEILFCVGEKIMRATATEVGAAYFVVGHSQRRLALRTRRCHGLLAHELLKQLPLLGRHAGRRIVEMTFPTRVKMMMRRKIRTPGQLKSRRDEGLLAII